MKGYTDGAKWICQWLLAGAEVAEEPAKEEADEEGTEHQIDDHFEFVGEVRTHLGNNPRVGQRIQEACASG